jgi:hypothetical protein
MTITVEFLFEEVDVREKSISIVADGQPGLLIDITELG